MVVVLALPYLCNGGRVKEYFESKSKDKKKKDDKKVKDKQKKWFESDAEADDSKEPSDQYKMKETFDASDNKLLDIDINVDSDSDDGEVNNAKGLKSFNDPYIAQKETYRLIDTVKQLKDATESMAPILKEGKGIMEAFKKLNIQM